MRWVLKRTVSISQPKAHVKIDGLENMAILRIQILYISAYIVSHRIGGNRKRS